MVSTEADPSKGCGSLNVRLERNRISASIYVEYSVGPSIRPICTRYCFTMTNMIQVCSNQGWWESWIKKEIKFIVFGNGVYYTACSLLVILKSSCSKLHGQKIQFVLFSCIVLQKLIPAQIRQLILHCYY